MSKRTRMTRRQATDHKASAPPATPGYGTEDQSHPAHTQPDPDADEYENGDTSSWAEDVHPPPYPEGNPPATPGYESEDQDHPAYERKPRNPKSAGLREQVIKKADKCIRLARHTLSKDASVEQIEDQALDYMDMPDEQLDSTLQRLGGGFLAQEDLMDMPMEDEMQEEAVGDLLDDDMMACGDMPRYATQLLEQVQALTAEVAALKEGSQNDPEGETLAPKPKSEEEARKEAAKKAEDDDDDDDDDMGDMDENQDEEADEDDDKEGAKKKAALEIFDQSDTDRDGFVSADEWKGENSVFASIDTDKDGYIARSEVLACNYGMEDMIEEEVVEPMAMGDMAMGDMVEVEEADVFAMTTDPMGLSGETPQLTEDDSLLAEIFGGEIGRVAAEEDEGKEKEEDAAESMQEKAEEKAKEKKAKEHKDEKHEEHEEHKEDEKEGKKATQRPQPKKASNGVQKVGHVATQPSPNKEIDELSNLWDRDPDVSKVFG